MIHRVAHLADTHINENRRLDDTRDVLAAFVQQASERGVDLIVHAGDFFDRKSTPKERNMLAAFIQSAASFAPFVGVKGNHDQAGDLDVFERLETKHPIRILTRPGWVEMGPFAVYGLPWFTRSAFLSSLPAGHHDASDEAFRGLLSKLLDSIRLTRDAQLGIPILLGHILVAGSETSTGQTLIGQTVEFSPADLLGLGMEYCALGHIHKPQAWAGAGAVTYSGSTERCNFGEPEAKGWTLATFENGVLLETEFVELPARKIALVESDLTPDVRGFVDGKPFIFDEAAGRDYTGELVRYRYRVRPEDVDRIDEEALRRSFIDAGAHDVKVEAIVEHGDRIRSEAIVDAATTWEKVCAFWDSKETTIEPERRRRLQSMLESIEGAGVTV